MAYRHSLIKSIQRGTIDVADGSSSNTASLSTSVDTNNAFVVWGGTAEDYNSSGSSNAGTSGMLRLSLTNSTTVTATGGTTHDGRHVDFQVIEFYPGVLKSAVQASTITVTGTSNTATLSPTVNANKTMLVMSGFTYDTQASGSADYVRLTLTDSATLTATRFGSTGTTVVGYAVVEFK